MGDVQVTQGFTLASTDADANLRVSQGVVLASTDADANLRVPQGFVLAAVKSPVFDPVIRSWTFTLDGHDFYVLKLGVQETLVYDTHSEQWSVWGSGETDLWRAFCGTNWAGGNLWAESYGSNVLAGDDTVGTLYLLDPLNARDDDASVGDATPRQFRREAMAQHSVRGYASQPCYGVELLGSIGQQTTGALTDVTLSVSDDRGLTYVDCGTVTVTSGDRGARLNWRSLGSMSAPGRLFKLVDYGALHRIDTLEMPD